MSRWDEIWFQYALSRRPSSCEKGDLPMILTRRDWMMLFLLSEVAGTKTYPLET